MKKQNLFFILAMFTAASVLPVIAVADDAFSASPVACPNFSGSYTCSDSRQDTRYEMNFTHTIFGNVNRYTETSEGITSEIIVDNVAHRLSDDPPGINQYRAVNMSYVSQCLPQIRTTHFIGKAEDQFLRKIVGSYDYTEVMQSNGDGKITSTYTGNYIPEGEEPVLISYVVECSPRE